MEIIVDIVNSFAAHDLYSITMSFVIGSIIGALLAFKVAEIERRELEDEIASIINSYNRKIDSMRLILDSTKETFKDRMHTMRTLYNDELALNKIDINTKFDNDKRQKKTGI